GRLDAPLLLVQDRLLARRAEGRVLMEEVVDAALVPARLRIERDLLRERALVPLPVARAVDDLAARRLEQPQLERRVAAVLELVDPFEHLAADRLHEVGLRLARAQDRAGVQPDEGAQPGEVAFEEAVDPVRSPRGGRRSRTFSI